MEHLSNNAAKRSQQLSIPKFILELILDYGQENRSHGATRYYLDRNARKTVKQKLGRRVYNKLSPMMDVYAVVNDDGSIRTVAKKYKRFKEPRRRRSHGRRRFAINSTSGILTPNGIGGSHGQR